MKARLLGQDRQAGVCCGLVRMMAVDQSSLLSRFRKRKASQMITAAGMAKGI
jgi:hypothetical protein